MKRRASSSGRSAISASILAASAATSVCGCGVARPPVGLERRGLAQPTLVDVEHDQGRLLGQEAVAADEQLLVVGQAERAERLSLVEVRLEPPQQLLLALGGLALGGRAMAALGRELLEALLDDRQVGDGELEVEVGDVAPRVGRRARRRRRRAQRGASASALRTRARTSGLIVPSRAAPAGMATST